MEGVMATLYNQGDKFSIDPAKLLPLTRYSFPSTAQAMLLIHPTICSVMYLSMVFLCQNSQKLESECCQISLADI